MPKSGLHTVSPYVGKIRPELAKELVLTYSNPSDTIFDPFSGSGTVLLEGWMSGRKVLGVDMNYYAYCLSMAKLFPYPSREIALEKLQTYKTNVETVLLGGSAYDYPDWVSAFFHPKTLQEAITWANLLKEEKEYFLLSNLMGILHHQRPGFLSYPSSHGAPYLRTKKYPIEDYPDMYSYRDVFSRLEKKIIRTYNGFPENLNFNLEREILYGNIMNITYSDLPIESDSSITIITSPPYMKSLTYARDNRLRLWFLGVDDWRGLDKEVSMSKAPFASLMADCFTSWADIQKSGDICILIVGDIAFDKKAGVTVPDFTISIADERGYSLKELIEDPANPNRKLVRTASKVKSEKICIFEKR
jgi:hypothetical protein